jgi:hypothetical protein
MKKLFLIIITLFFSSPLIAKAGCFQYGNSGSYFDYKEKVYVECYCPCTYLDKHNQCLECGHFHDAAPLTVVTRSKELPITINKNITPRVDSMKAVYAALVKNFKEKEQASESETE